MSRVLRNILVARDLTALLPLYAGAADNADWRAWTCSVRAIAAPR